MAAAAKKHAGSNRSFKSTWLPILLLTLVSQLASTVSAWDVRGQRIALHAQSSSLVHGFVAGSEYTCLGLKSALLSRGAAHVRIFSPGLYGAVEDDPSTVWDAWDLVVIEGWFDMLPSFVHAIRTFDGAGFLRHADIAIAQSITDNNSDNNHNTNRKGPVILYYCLDVYSPDLLHKILHLNVDGYLTNSEVLLPTLRAVSPTLLMHLAVDPERMNRVASPRPEYQHPIVFVGQFTTKKQYLLPMLREAAATGQLSIYGFGWNASEPLLRAAYRGVLPVEDLCEVYSGSDLVIGTTDDLQREHGMVNNRVVEVLACGAFLISDHFDSLEQTVGNKEGVYFYKKRGDIERILTAHEKQTKKVNIAGQQAVLSRHTYDHRVNELLSFLGELEQSDKRGPGCTNALRIGVLFMRPTAQTNFDNGFVSALQVLQSISCYNVTWINLATMTQNPCETFASCGGNKGEPLKFIIDVEKHFVNLDVLLVKSNWDWYPDTVTRQLLRNLDMRKALVISGVAAPPTIQEMLVYDVLYYETAWYMSLIIDHPNFEQAFGVNTELLQPMPDVAKVWDILSIGSVVDYKRHERLIFDSHRKRIAIVGDVIDVALANRLREANITILEPVAHEALAKLINSARVVRITAGLSGGGERAVLEARACGVPVQVEPDNPKLQELADLEHVPDHRHYAFHLQRGITRMFCLGRGLSSISIEQHKDEDIIGSLVDGGTVRLNGPTVFPIKPVISHFDIGPDGFWCLYVRLPFRTDHAVLKKCTSDTRVEMFLSITPPSSCFTDKNTEAAFVSFRLVLRSNVFVDEIRTSEWVTVQVMGPTDLRKNRVVPVCVSSIDFARCETIVSNSDPYATLTYYDLTDPGINETGINNPTASSPRNEPEPASPLINNVESTPLPTREDHSRIVSHSVHVASQGAVLTLDLGSPKGQHLWLECEDYICEANGTMHLGSSRIPVTISLWGQGSLALSNTVRRSLVVAVNSPYALEFEHEQGGEQVKPIPKVTRFLLLSLFEDRTRLGYVSAANLFAHDSELWFASRAAVHVRVALDDHTKGGKLVSQSAGMYMMIQHPLDAISARVGMVLSSPNLQIMQRDNDDRLLGWDVKGAYGEPVPDWSPAYADLHSMNADEMSVKYVEEMFNMDGYVAWMTINSLLLNGDSIDEAFFFSINELGGSSNDRKRQSAQVLPWDFDTVFSPCHLNGVRDVGDPLLFCAESVVDRLISRNSPLRLRFKAALARVLDEHTPRVFCGRSAGIALLQVIAFWEDPDFLCASFEFAPGCDTDVIRARFLQGHSSLCNMFDKRHEQLLDRLTAELDGLKESDSSSGADNCDERDTWQIVEQVWHHLHEVNGESGNGKNDSRNWPDAGLSQLVVSLPIDISSDHKVVIKVSSHSPGTAAHVLFEMNDTSSVGDAHGRINDPGLYVVHICVDNQCDLQATCSVHNPSTVSNSIHVVIIDKVRGSSEFGLKPWTPSLSMPEWEEYMVKQKERGHLTGSQFFIPRAFPADLDGQALALPLHVVNVRRRNGRISEWTHQPKRVSFSVQAVVGGGGGGRIHAPSTQRNSTRHVVFPLGHGVLMIDLMPSSATGVTSGIDRVTAVVDTDTDTVWATQEFSNELLSESETGDQTSQSRGLTVHLTMDGSIHVLQVELDAGIHGESKSTDAKGQDMWQRISDGESVCEGCVSTWAAGSRVHLNGSFTVQPNAILHIEAGTVVVVTGTKNSGFGEIVLARGARLLVHGTADQHVILTAPRSKNWGGIVASGQDSMIQLTHTTLLRTGAGGSIATGVYGHRGERSAFTLSEGASLSMTDCVLAHGVGQAFAITNSSLVLLRTLVQGFQAGGEVFHSNATLTESVLTDFPDRLPHFADGDNDALYVVGGHLIATRSIFAYAKDDGVDSGTGVGGLLSFHKCSFVACFHEGLAITSQIGAPKNVIVRQSIFLNNQQGVEVGWTTSDTNVVVEGSWFIGNQVGVRYGDNYAASVNGHLTVVDSTFEGNSEDMWAYVRKQANIRGDNNQHMCKEIGDIGGKKSSGYSKCFNVIWNDLVSDHANGPALVDGGSLQVADMDSDGLSQENYFGATKATRSSVSEFDAVAAPVVFEFKASGMLVQVKRGESGEQVAHATCLQILNGDVSACVEQLATYINTELEFVDNDVDGNNEYMGGESTRQRVEIVVTMDGRSNKFRMNCGDDLLLRSHLFCKSLGQAYECFKTVSAAVMRWLAADKVVCTSPTSSQEQISTNPVRQDSARGQRETIDSVGVEMSWQRYQVSTATIMGALSRLPHLTSILEHSYTCEAADEIAKDIPNISVTCIKISNTENCPASDTDVCDVVRHDSNSTSPNLIIASQPSLAAYIPDMARAPDMVDVQLCLSGCNPKVVAGTCEDSLTLLGDMLSLARYTILVPKALHLPNDAECSMLSSDPTQLLTNAAAAGNIAVRVSYVGVARMSDGKASSVLMVEVTQLSRSADHHMRASEKLGWWPNYYTLKLGGGELVDMKQGYRLPWAVRMRDGKRIPFRYVGLTLNTLLELKPDSRSLRLLTNWFAEVPVSEDMAPWNLVYTRGSGLVFVDEQVRLVSELNVNYMYTLVKLHPACVWNAETPVQAFQQCILLMR